MTERDETAVLVYANSGIWRRRLRPLAWAALEHLALAARPDQHGWVAHLGVRDIAAGIGVTKDTAARAVTALRAAGLVSLERLERIDGRRRTGYRLHLPEGIQLQARPQDQHSPSQRKRFDHCPDTADKKGCPNCPDSGLAAGPALVQSAVLGPRENQPRRRRRTTASVETVQPSLFDPSGQMRS